MRPVYAGASNIVSPLGFTTASNMEALLSGKTALGPHRFEFASAEFFCGKIPDGEIQTAYRSVSNLPASRLEKMSAISLADVLSKNKIDLKSPRTLLIISTTKGNIDHLENHCGDGKEYLPAFADFLCALFSCANTPMLVSNACISGLLALIIGQRLISADFYDHVAVLGADLVSEFTLSGFRSFNALSGEACRPFDAQRNGINLGEAAASILLSAENASDVRLLKGASANDANHISGPSRTGNGLFQALEEILDPESLPDFISAHGTATPYNDEMEAVAFFRAGIHQLPVHSLKGYYGHTLGAAGVLESAIGMECLRKNILLRSAGFEQIGVSHLSGVIGDTRQQSIRSFLKTASGFGGCNAAALFEKLT